MTHSNPARRMLARWIVAAALVPLALSAVLSGLVAPSAAPLPSAPPSPTDAAGSGAFLSAPTGSPAVPTGEDAVAPPWSGAVRFAAFLDVVLPADQLGTLPEVFTPDDAVLYVKSDSLSLRDGPGTKYKLLHKLAYAEKVTRTGYGADWSRVATTDGRTGYVATKYLSTSKPAPKVSAADLLRAKVVAVAKQQLGVPYVHYAASPTAGFDCSGLVWYAYRMNGISVPRSAASYATFGTRVKKSQLKPGDVLCWDTYKDGVTKLNHVTMYVGNGIMIEAPGGGKVVRYSVLEGYYATLLDIRRIIQ